jgi:phage gpG-like protein
MSVTGDFGKLQSLITELQHLGDKKVIASIAKLMGEEGLTLVKQGFERGAGPYGRWQAVQLRSGTPLAASGRLKNSFTTNVQGLGFVVGTNTKYARVHQYGATIVPVTAKALRFRGYTRTAKGRKKYGAWIFAKKVVIPARPMVPNGSDVPMTWQVSLRRAGEEALYQLSPKLFFGT